jgi:3D (Asp-Asp-Asp) domain-containing protein
MPDNVIVFESFDFPAPTEVQKAERFKFWATFYHVEKIKPTADGEPLLDMSGKPLGPKFPAKEWCHGALEGTIAIENENGKLTIFNHAGEDRKEQVNCRQFFDGRFPDLGKKRWELARGPFGDGIKLPGAKERMILVPFRTIAVDGSQIPVKFTSLIFIPDARGAKITLPSGLIVNHDGYFFAADTGSGIKNNHIDVFGGNSDKNPFPNFIDGEKNIFDAFLIDNEEIRESLRKLHKG